MLAGEGTGPVPARRAWRCHTGPARPRATWSPAPPSTTSRPERFDRALALYHAPSADKRWRRRRQPAAPQATAPASGPGEGEGRLIRVAPQVQRQPPDRPGLEAHRQVPALDG